MANHRFFLQGIARWKLDADFWSRVRGSTFVFKEEHSEEVIEVDAPNSVIEAMIKAEMHKGKKIKFVRKS